ncbi:maleylpyruvate isomerase N-terminal domain-containing protein [Kitasatospora sp. NPDC002227]|uniref:maleylpyruvate isomerase N-terminal domain-containing protein n=1 Tax=Kitasatospora sp. NPDC002227 TaxID=3154773 RepID=UPI00332A86E9
MDHVSHFRREVRAFEAAIRPALLVEPVPMVPSCPAWSAADLTVHLGGVHRYVSRILGRRLTTEPDPADLTIYGLPADLTGWPLPTAAPNRGAPPPLLADWFAEGADELAALLGAADPAEPVWTWAPEQSAGFWLRIQTIEAAVHRWDAEGVFGTPAPVDAELAADAVPQFFEVMAPARRAWRGSPPGAGERYRLRRTDGPGCWTVCFDGAQVSVAAPEGGACDLELAGTASDLMLHLWRRGPADRLAATGDEALHARLFELVPPE